MIDTDMLIVGAGPTGLYAAYYAGFRGLRTTVLDSLSQAGGQIAALYPEKLIYDVAGFPGIKGRELVNALVTQAERYEPTWVFGDSAIEVERADDGKLCVTTRAGTRIRTPSVVIAGGIGIFTPRPLPAGGEYVGRGVEYVARDFATYAGKHVLIIGGGDSALDWALALEPIAASVTVAHRRAKFTAHEASVAALHRSSASVLTPYVINRLIGTDTVEQAVLRNAESGEETVIDCTHVVAALGFTANLGPLTGWGLKIIDRHIVVDSAMWTGLEGVYAAGDITEYPGKVRLISVAFGEAALAVNNAATSADSSITLFPGHSSELV